MTISWESPSISSGMIPSSLYPDTVPVYLPFIPISLEGPIHHSFFLISWQGPRISSLYPERAPFIIPLSQHHEKAPVYLKNPQRAPEYFPDKPISKEGPIHHPFILRATQYVIPSSWEGPIHQLQVHHPFICISWEGPNISALHSLILRGTQYIIPSSLYPERASDYHPFNPISWEGPISSSLYPEGAPFIPTSWEGPGIPPPPPPPPPPPRQIKTEFLHCFAEITPDAAPNTCMACGSDEPPNLDDPASQFSWEWLSHSVYKSDIFSAFAKKLWSWSLFSRILYVGLSMYVCSIMLYLPVKRSTEWQCIPLLVAMIFLRVCVHA